MPRPHVLRRDACLAIAWLAVAAPAGAQCPVDHVLGDDTLAGDQLGDAVAISGGIAVAGASRHDALGSASGAAFVFTLGSDENGRLQWAQEARLLADSGAANDLFGSAVAIDSAASPAETIVVGAYFDDNVHGNEAGAAYVYEADYVGEDRQWLLAQTLIAPDGSAGDQFGEAVAVHGDLLAIGAPRHDGTALNAGAVYVYRHTGSMWAHETTLEIPGSAEHDLFGVAVAIDVDTILVGAAFSDNAGINSGVAYAFRYAGSAWGTGELIVPEDPAAQDKFGEAIALRGDVAMIGATFDDDGGANAGSVYVFTFDGAWIQRQKLTASDFETDARFGTSVAFSDGVEDGIAIIGAPRASEGGVDSGAAYVFTFDGVDWVESMKLTASEAASGDRFGFGVGTDDQFIVIGANLDDDETAGDNAGSVDFFTTGLEDLVDCNGNGLSDFCDLANGVSLDCNANGVPDECDIDPTDPDGNGEVSADVDGNGVPDECDDCNENLIPDFSEIEGDPALDCNENGILDVCEIPVEHGEEGEYFCMSDCDPDCNMNGIPDACEIADGTVEDCNTNGIPDVCEIPVEHGEEGEYFCMSDCDPDCNTNGIPDACEIADGTAQDCNTNGIPDWCDIDSGESQDEDGDGVPDECFSDCNNNGTDDQADIDAGTSQDCNTNGIPDECDIDPDDPDGDGRVFPDLNADGIPDECQDCNDNMIPDFFEIAANPDLDCNDNEIIDACEIPVEQSTEGVSYYCIEDCDPDCNLNGIPDECDLEDGTSQDINTNGIPDECEDCNANGTIDTEDVATGTSEDCNSNGIPDECEIPIEQSTEEVSYYCIEDCDPDCNLNGIPDECDIIDGTVEDCDLNGVPDQCDPDCNENGIPDECDLEDPNSDLNMNGILDVCEPDCNENGYPDFLEIIWGLVEDLNENGIPDECETCVADVDGDGDAGFGDVLRILASWGNTGGPEDVDGDGEVGFGDLLTVLAVWGPCE